MSNNFFPKQQDLSNVTRGAGFYTGTMTKQHEVLDYLDKNALILSTDSVRAVFSAIKHMNWKPAREESSNEQGTRDGFYTFSSLQEAVDVYSTNPQSIRTFTEEAIKLTAEESIGKDVHFDVVGDYIDIGRFLDGEPECFGVAYQGNPSGLYTTLIMNLSAVAHVTADAMNHRQARILRLVDWMESQGVRCQIRGFISTACSHMDIRVKNFDEAIDMNALAVVSHGDFLRRINFVVDEQSETWTWGYGSPRVFTSRMTRNYKADPADGLTIFVSDQSHSNKDDIDKAFDTLRDKVAELIESPQNRDFTKVYSVEL
jgi:hypothetical protein